jgi:hypothetical protein
MIASSVSGSTAPMASAPASHVQRRVSMAITIPLAQAITANEACQGAARR